MLTVYNISNRTDSLSDQIFGHQSIMSPSMSQIESLQDTGLWRHIPGWEAFQIVANIYHVKSDLTSMMVTAISFGLELPSMRT